MSFSGVGLVWVVNRSESYSVRRSITAGRSLAGRWEVLDAAGVVVAIVARERRRRGGAVTFTVIHNPTGIPFRPPPGRRLRALGAWSSAGHDTIPAAVAALTRHLAGPSPQP